MVVAAAAAALLAEESTRGLLLLGGAGQANTQGAVQLGQDGGVGDGTAALVLVNHLRLLVDELVRAPQRQQGIVGNFSAPAVHHNCSLRRRDGTPQRTATAERQRDM